MARKNTTFKLRKTDQVGAAGAEEDQEFLAHCFVDTGNFGLIQTLSDHRMIILGRTGTGKTALVQQLVRTYPDRVIQIRPTSLALTYVANSTVLNFFASLGVNLDPFFALLWRHVFTVEILSRHFQQHVPVKGETSLLDWLKNLFIGTSRRDKEMTQAVKYLEEWGESFWQETEYRVKEITQKVETELSDKLTAGVKGKLFSFSADTANIQKLTEDEKAELVSRGQDVVSKAQVRDLHNVCQLLDNVLEDRQKQYYLVVDGLDENWVEERLRYRLIMALINTAKDFISVKNAKVIIALRRDLIDRVFRLARGSGFQEEKYQSLYLPLTWTKKDLLELLDRRVHLMVARRYTKRPVSYKDLLPATVDNMPIDDYLYSLARRPRDVIAFFNTCILAGVDEPKLSQKELHIAEGEYSRTRLRALGDEWAADYPLLLEFTRILEKQPASFKISSLSNRLVEDHVLDLIANHPSESGPLFELARSMFEGHLPTDEFLMSLIHVFYKIGIVGLKVLPDSTTSWRDDAGQSVSRSELNGNVSVVINPTYRRALGTRTHR